MHESPASVSVSFRIHSRRVASSSGSAGRAHTSHALRSPASEAKCALRPVRQRLIRSLRLHPAESSRGAVKHPGFGLSASSPWFHPARLPSRLTSRSSRRRVVASLKLMGMRAILAPIRRVRRGLTPALGAEKHSVVVLFALQLCLFRLQRFSESLSPLFGFGRCAVRAQPWSFCSSRLPWADIRAVALVLPVASFGSAAVSVRGAPSFSGFGLLALSLAFCSSRVPSRLTVRSSRRRISASLKLAAVRAILAPHCCGRRGLTQALGPQLWPYPLKAAVESSLQMLLIGGELDPSRPIHKP
jgi:hypothetical protein